METISTVIERGRVKMILPIITDSDFYGRKYIYLNVADIAAFRNEARKGGATEAEAVNRYSLMLWTEITQSLDVECSEPRYSFEELKNVVQYLMENSGG